MAVPSKVAMSGEEIDATMREVTYCRIASHGPGPRLNLTPMSFSWTGGEPGQRVIYLWARGQKVMNLRRNPECTVIVDDGQGFANLRGVMLHCRGTVLEDAAAEEADPLLAEARVELGRKYRVVGEDGAANETPWPGTARGKTWRWVRLEPYNIVTWNNRKMQRPEVKSRYGTQMLKGDGRE